MAKVAIQLNSELQGEHYLDLNYLHVGPTKNGGGGGEVETYPYKCILMYNQRQR